MSKTKCNAALFALACTVLLTLPDPARAYSLKQTDDGNQVRWYRDAVTLRVDAKLDGLLSGDAGRAAAIMASEAWRGLPGTPDILIAEGEPPTFDPTKRSNGIYLISDWTYAPNDVALTLVTYDQSGAILGTDILINANKTFAMLSEGSPQTAPEKHDLAAVLTHEFGHVLGLLDSADDEQATMWPYIRVGESHQRSLSTDDEDGVAEAYSRAAISQPGACSVGGVTGRNTGSAGTLLLAAMAAAFVVRRARRMR